MEQNKINDLAKSFTTACKQALKDSQLPQHLTSPAVIALGMTIMSVMIKGEIDKKVAWAIT